MQVCSGADDDKTWRKLIFTQLEVRSHACHHDLIRRNEYICNCREQGDKNLKYSCRNPVGMTIIVQQTTFVLTDMVVELSLMLKEIDRKSFTSCFLFALLHGISCESSPAVGIGIYGVISKVFVPLCRQV